MAEQKTMVRDLTQGSIAKNLIKYAAPLFVANTLQAVYNVVDMMVVGQVEGGISLAAVSIGGDIIHLLTFLLMGFTTAGQIMLSQYVGAQKKESIRHMIGTLFTVTFIIAAAMLVIGLLLGDSLMTILNADARAVGAAKTYYVTCLCGLFFIAEYNTVCAILRGMGDSRHPFYFIAIASILNIVLDILFVAGFHWSTFGAALATVIGQAVSFIIAIIYLIKHKLEFGFDFKLKSFKISSEVIGQLIKLGIPMSIQMAAITISKTLLSAWINAYGYEYSALAGIYNKLSLFIGIVSNSLTTAGAANIAQNIGAAKYHRVPKILGLLALLSGCICVTVTVLLLIFPEPFFRLFTSDPAVIDISYLLIEPMAVCFIGAIARTVGFSLINGSGNSKMNLVVALFDGIIGRIGFSYLLGFVLHLGCRGFWFGDGIAGYMPFIVSFVFFLTGRWKKNDHIVK